MGAARPKKALSLTSLFLEALDCSQSNDENHSDENLSQRKLDSDMPNNHGDEDMHNNACHVFSL